MRGSKVAIYDRGDEPDAPDGSVETPSWLDDDSRKHWDRLVPMLDSMRLLSPAYQDSLAMFCECLAEYERLVKLCREEPPCLVGEKGGQYQNPMYQMRDKAMDKAVKLGKEFGFTPASKANCTAEGASSKGAGKKGLIRGA